MSENSGHKIRIHPSNLFSCSWLGVQLQWLYMKHRWPTTPNCQSCCCCSHATQSNHNQRQYITYILPIKLKTSLRKETIRRAGSSDSEDVPVTKMLEFTFTEEKPMKTLLWVAADFQSVRDQEREQDRCFLRLMCTVYSADIMKCKALVVFVFESRWSVHCADVFPSSPTLPISSQVQNVILSMIN